MAIDWIIPLGSGSRSKDDQLRILLRSLEKNAWGLGRVIVVSEKLPDWLSGVEHVSCGDPRPDNKDGNMIAKVKAAVDSLRLGRFILSCDDCALMKPLELETLPPVSNARGQDAFGPDFKKGKWDVWPKRVWHTFWLAKERRLDLRHNYQSHMPQLFYDARGLSAALDTVNWDSPPGYSIFTLFRILQGQTGGQPQSLWKTTHESADQVRIPPTKTFCGYNDDAFLHGLREWLFMLFPAKSRFQSD